MISVCTITAGNYLPYVRVFADSFFAHHPGGSLTVLLVDDEARQLDPGDARIEWRRLSDLGLERDEIHRLAGIYDVTELSTAVKPLLLRRLLDEGRGEVIYLDPDIRIFGSLDDLVPLARQHGIVLTPHTMAPLPKDGRQIDDLFILSAGVYNLGFIAVGASARPFLDWWWQCTRREALIDIARMMFTDQRWVDFVPSLFDPYILKDPGYNVAYWNLHARQVTVEGDRYLVDGVPLRFFHFSGFELQRPWLLSRHQAERPRVLLSEHPLLARICQQYAASLRQAGWDDETTATALAPGEGRPYGWRTAAAGFALDGRMRRLYWQAVRAAEQGQAPQPPDPFDTANPEAFLAWLNAPAERGPRRVSRYLYSIYLDRHDLQIVFPDIFGVHAAAFAEWAWREGVTQEQLLVELLPPRADDEAASVQAATIQGAPIQRAPLQGAPPTLAPGLNIAGYFRSEMGIGEAARLLVRAADAAQIPHATVTVDSGPYRQQHPFDDRAAGAQPYDINLLCINADATRRFARDIGPAFFAGRHTVGYWFWEVEPFAPAMYDAFHHVDEVWVATDYMADILRGVGLRPVHTVPMAVPVPVCSPAITRAQLGLPDRFLFLALFDFLSVATRKNPLGLIDAFSAAFAPDEGPVLLIKSINGHLRVPELERVRIAAAARPDIVVLDQYYGADKKDALLGACDCYVSLHRAEGLGLTMAEAMALGKPVIATGYSGNRHFMTPENSYLVDYTLEAIPAGCEPYPERGRWAAPDLDHAARLLREVYERPADAARRARRGQADILERHGLRTAVAALTQRVEAIRHERRQRIVVPQDLAEAQLQLDVETEADADVGAVVAMPEPEAMLVPGPEAEARAARDARDERAKPDERDAPDERAAPVELNEPGERNERDEREQAIASSPPAVVTALEALVPLLEQLAEPRLSAHGRAWPSARLAAQRALFRVLRPYWFQQRQFQEALIGALLTSVKTLAGEVKTLTGEVTALRAATDTRQTQTDAQLQTLTEAKGATETSLADLSTRLFAVPYIAGRERFVQRGPTGNTRLGYGDATANGSNGHAHSDAVHGGSVHNAPVHGNNGPPHNRAVPNDAAQNSAVQNGDGRRVVEQHDVERNGGDRHNGVAHAGDGQNGFRQDGAGRDGAGQSGGGQNDLWQNGARQNGAGPSGGAQNGVGHEGWRRREPLFRIRQRLYLPLLTPRAPVLDIGCGRGGMLDLLRVAKVAAVGIDRDPDMVGHCRAQGHTVEQADALQFLRTRPDGSVGSIFSARLIEHLSFEQLQEFLRLCRSRLARGGMLIAETENPRGFEALARPWIEMETQTEAAAAPSSTSSTASTSSTHAIGPELALALCELAGFERAHVLFPTGTGDLDPDRHVQGHYTVVATAGAPD